MNPPSRRNRRSDRRNRHAGACRRPRCVRAQFTKMAEFARSAGVRVRPHAKTHKSAAIALRQIAQAPSVSACQKVGEAEALVRGGVTDVLVSNEVVGDGSCAGLQRSPRMRRSHCASTPPNRSMPRRASRRSFGVELGALVEIEVGMERCGVAPGKAAAALARRIADAPDLQFRGLQAYHGRAQHLPTHQQRAQAIAVGRRRRCDETLDALEGARIFPARSWREPAPARSRSRRTAGSRTSFRSARMCSWTPTTRRSATRTAAFTPTSSTACSCLPRSSAVPTPDRAIVDAGLKSYSGEKGSPWVHGREDVQRHQHFRRARQARARRRRRTPLQLGDKVWLIPGHCDPTVNLHDWYVGVRHGRVEALWPISARGAST